MKHQYLTMTWSLTLATAICFTAGCNPESNENALAIESISMAEKGEPLEMFIFVAESERERIASSFNEMLLRQLFGGSVVHLIECPQHRLVTTITVPFGNGKTRSKNRVFRAEYEPAYKFFERAVESESSDQLAVTTVAETVENIRRTEMKSRLILCGSLIYHDERRLAFSTKTLVPSDGLLGHPHSPWLSHPKLPEYSQVSWLTESVRFGNSANHRKGITRFNRLFLKTLDGHVVRITPDPVSAFSFAEPYLKNDITLRSEKPKMINHDIDIRLGDPETDQEPSVIPIETNAISFSKKGTLKYDIEMLGGDPSSLTGEAIVLWLVVDGSGSMANGQSETKQTILRIAESLPELVTSLEIGIAVHRNGLGNRFPITQILDSTIDGGASLGDLKSFLNSIRADGGDAMMQQMLADGRQQLSKTGIGKRQFLMVVADYVGFGLDSLGEFEIEEKKARHDLKHWCNQPGTDRLVVSMYSGEKGKMEDFFRGIGASNGNSLFSRDPQDLIRELLASAIPIDTPTSK